MPEATIPTPIHHDKPSPLSPSLPTPKPLDKPAPPPSPPPVAPESKTPPPPPSAPEPNRDNTPEPAAPPSEAEDDIVDMETFRQILELDDDATHDFSKGMAWAFFTQAEQTFKDMDKALTDKDLTKLSSLGHFLKGSSAALGLSKVQASCELIQHYGQRRDEEAGMDVTAAVALDKIGTLLSQVNDEYTVAENWLKDWYDKNAEEPEPQPESS
ncbi:histidine-phosphotransfer domain HPT domain-containing protein [Lyophyllum atratum]|nr:histidine-phosphotransfer domain HPT domain-containing protein [Lyophyllum atratum]